MWPTMVTKSPEIFVYSIATESDNCTPNGIRFSKRERLCIGQNTSRVHGKCPFKANITENDHRQFHRSVWLFPQSFSCACNTSHTNHKFFVFFHHSFDTFHFVQFDILFCNFTQNSPLIEQLNCFICFIFSILIEFSAIFSIERPILLWIGIFPRLFDFFRYEISLFAMHLSIPSLFSFFLFFLFFWLCFVKSNIYRTNFPKLSNKTKTKKNR